MRVIASGCLNRWLPNSSRILAARATARCSKRSVARPTAEWLAFRGLACFPVTGTGDTLKTTGCARRRKNGSFVWPLWQGPAGGDAVRSLVSWPGIDRLGPAERSALGIAAVLEARLTKMADGRAGVFSPSRPA